LSRGRRGGRPAETREHFPWSDRRGDIWRLVDTLSDARYDRKGDEMQDAGLYVAMDPWNCHFLHCWRAPSVSGLRGVAGR